MSKFIDHIIKKKCKFVSFVILLYITHSTTGCSEKFQKDAPNSGYVLQKMDLGKFKVIIDNPSDREVTVLRSAPWTDEITKISANQTGPITDENPKTGEYYIYRVGTTKDKKFIENFSLSVKIPLEIVTSEFNNIPAHYYNIERQSGEPPKLTIDKLVVDKGFPLTLNHGYAEIVVNSLVSSDGVIETYNDQSSPAKFGKDEYLKLPFKFKILSGEGDVHFVLRGQKGAQPPQANPMGTEGQGAKGKKGQNGWQLYVYNYQLGDTRVSCNRPIGQGTPGEKGRKGNPGFQGVSGGNSPELFLEISPDAKIEYSFERSPGKGGDGGLGGLGGSGGLPGDNGDVESSAKTEGDPEGSVYFLGHNSITSQKQVFGGECKDPGPGSVGPLGDLGDQGLQGSDGIIQKICIKDFNNNNWKCEK